MRKFLILISLLMAIPCFANDQKWYILNRESGCQSLTEMHETWPDTEGLWTPTSLLSALDGKYHDAKLVPFIDIVMPDIEEGGDEEKIKKRRKFFKDFTQSNAFILSSFSGKIEVPIITRDLCQKLKVLPVEPEQWLSEETKRGNYSVQGWEIPGGSWYEVRAGGHRMPNPDLKEKDFMESSNYLAANQWMANRVADSDLKEKDFVELSDDMATYYAGKNYSSELNKHPYLVRGVSSGKAGHIKPFYNGEVLFVFYEDSNAPLYFAPLVVNLPSAPTSVVISPYRATK